MIEPDEKRPQVRPGFRLGRFEVLNWGTLHSHVWALNCRGDNALLTGDIGSGKSTLVDGISTLLVAPQKITYNRAAGADARERTLRSYVLGHYKSERGDPGLSARPIALRDTSQYSVILGQFFSEQIGVEVTLAQVFWWKDTQGQPARFYVVADGELTIREHFAGFGKNMDTLRKRLRAMPSVELHDTFPPYGTAFRRRFGIASEQAMDLFYQTISMKSVGNLTEFVRAHMLETFPVQDRIDALVGHFDDLTRAHEAVIRSRQQIERLTPIVADCDRHASLTAHADGLRSCREALTPWFAELKSGLLAQRLMELDNDASRLTEDIHTLAEQWAAQDAKTDGLRKAIAENGGDRLAAIEREITQREGERDARRRQAARYSELARSVELSPPTDVEAFHRHRSEIAAWRETSDSQLAELQNAVTDAEVTWRALSAQYDTLEKELVSLRGRRSNLPAHTLALRARMCSALDLDEKDLPFAGELLQVRSDARDWEGAIERLLRNFGASLLVHDTAYSRVAAWVDRNHLNGRLVYYRTTESPRKAPRSRDARSVAVRLQIEPNSPFYDWLDSEVAKRFDHECCANIEELRRTSFGLTRAGQIKSGSERHEKDDRYAVDDRTQFILGWSNEAKIAALTDVQQSVAAQGKVALAKRDALATEQTALDNRRTSLIQLQAFETFRDLDWQQPAREIEDLRTERRQLEQSSDLLKTLGEQLAESTSALKAIETARETAVGEKGAVANRRQSAEVQRIACVSILATANEELWRSQAARLADLRDKVLGGTAPHVESCESEERQMRSVIQGDIDADERKLTTQAQGIASAMRGYIASYPQETREVDASLASASEYTTMLTRLQSDGLPRFEARFKSLLNENTIREIANFQSQLSRECQTIRDRIGRINHSLRSIDYNPGRHIVLEADQTSDVEIRDFQQQLRACTEGALTGSQDDAYSEAKFLEVKRIIDRFRSREGTADGDRRWTRKVTDVRNWFQFSASERWHEGGKEHEHYSDSGGKSGGQKEKLAYTVLAASLAYQFGLDPADNRMRTFRFVVIDEAFGRGSDESARYGLTLFQRLELQLLVVTPLQKIHIIEPYVAAVGFVHNPDGSSSMLRNLTIEEYRAERAALHA
ncbi:ATP-binding protein [soil metagenome]